MIQQMKLQRNNCESITIRTTDENLLLNKTTYQRLGRILKSFVSHCR
jgi:hypothetical protein